MMIIFILKKGRFSGVAQIGPFSFKNIKIEKAGGVSENSGNLHQDRHKNF